MGAAAFPAIGLGMSAAQGVNSGIKGKQAADQAETLSQEQLGLGRELLGTGQELLQTQQNAYNNFSRPGMGQQVTDMAQQAGADIQGIASGASGQLGALAGQAGNLGQISAPNGISQSAINPDTLGQTIQNALDFSQRQRTSAMEQTATGFAQGADALNEQLAARGLSAGSGVAAGALGDLARQGAQARTGLERDLATQAGQQALQAGQFDIQNTLSSQQLQNQYNLGFNQLDQAAQGQNIQNQLAGLGLSGDLIQGGAQLGIQGAQAPYQLAQSAYSQNYLNPQMQVLGMMNPAAYIGAGSQALGEIGDRYTQGSAAAGAGKGSAKGAIPGMVQQGVNAWGNE